MSYKIIQGDNRETLKTIPDNSIDAIVTDPPYGIDFLGKAWDANTGALETYQECLRVLKPGGHILAFSAARTYHYLAVTLEQAGFEIRDQIMWIYSSGFPKSQDIGRQIQKKLGVKETKRINATQSRNKEGLVAPDINNAGYEDHYDVITVTDPEAKVWEGWGTQLKPAHEPIALARKPMKTSIAQNCQKYGTGALNIDATRVEERFPSNVIGEILQEDYQKYFYCPKTSRKERHIGHDMPPPMFGDKQGAYDDNGQRYAVELDKRTGNVGNNHPTVKPVELMKYLIKLVTPPGGTVLDPFNGSGSTGMAAVELGHPYIGCELDPAYVEIAEKRIAAWLVKDTVEPKLKPVEAVANNFELLFQ
jgi:site-specific DNA-methyltransferase (adenine-specific)